MFWGFAMTVEMSACIPSPLAGAEDQDEGSAINGVDAVGTSLLQSASESKPAFRHEHLMNGLDGSAPTACLERP